jgi:hypothetical protein
MKVKYLLLFLCFCFSLHLATAQAYYRLKYQPKGDNVLVEDAFLVIYDNGVGFVRINQPGSVLYEMEIGEQFVFRPDGSIDTTLIIYEGKNAVLKKGNASTESTPLSFWFKLNPVTNNAEPWMVTVDSKDTASGLLFQSVELIDNRQLSDTSFVLSYFTRDEAFFQNRFGPKSRGMGLSTEEKKTRLWILVVAQANDKTIGPGTLVDARNVLLTFRSLAAFLNIKPVIDTVFGDRYGQASVKNAINKLRPSANDIVVFWYSGHGFSDEKSSDTRRRSMQYSFLDLLDPRQKPRPNPRDSTLNIEDIYKMILMKPARLRLVVSDCCNDEIIPKKEDKAPLVPKPKGPIPRWNWNNVYALLMKPRQSMLMTAASRGESAFSDNTRGSVFTNSLLASLTSSVLPDAAKPDWKKIWKTAQQQTIMKINNAKIDCTLPDQPKSTCSQNPPEIKVN